MAFRFQRRMTLFPGVRINFSKSGLSTTIGVPGASINLGSQGPTLNLGIPGTGLAYRRRLGGGGAAPAFEPEPEPPALPERPPENRIESASVTEITSEGLEQLKSLVVQAERERAGLAWRVNVAIDELDDAKRLLRRAEHWFLGLFLRKHLEPRRTAVEAKEAELDELRSAVGAAFVDADFDLEDGAFEAWGTLASAFEKLAASARIWDVTGWSDQDRVATRSAAGISVQRQPVRFALAEDQGILRSQAKTLHMQNANGADLLVFPAFLLVRHPGDFGLLDLQDVRAKFSTVEFVEDDSMPRDAELAGHVWAKSNRDGSPDRRFKGNYQIPLARYGAIDFKSATGLHERYMVSSAGAARRFVDAFQSYQAAVRSGAG